MRKHTKKAFRCARELFDTYVPGYIPPEEREEGSDRDGQERRVETSYANRLVQDFRRKIRL